ncbi:hypothetical protein [Catenuloplanes indicus]|uniref:Uncharacterized protein n=1 Tax=Catenuloplanes indicus TaxID=137267 RepID=A0AAE4B4B2_9ACTN|nr:hypothetical protein [Catenuloplanes indicus]MDQ0371178.1 hypothetical protein [Catenuloplanes indicus]
MSDTGTKRVYVRSADFARIAERIHMERLLRGDRLAVLDLDPGIVVGLVTEFEEQTLGLLRVVEGANPWSSGVPSVPLDRLDPVTASELMRDLTLLITS